MQKIDVNCLFGNWPFRKMYHGTLADLEQVHAENNFCGGYISSLQSIFYNDPVEAEEELSESIQGTDYKQIFTINPTLPSFASNIADAIEKFHIVGVRIYPGYHQFRLDDPCMKQLYEILRQFNLPLYVTVRMEDERLNYMVTPRIVTIDELCNLPDAMPDINILYTNILTGEAVKMKNSINLKPNVFIDTSCLKAPTGCLEFILEQIDDSKILYGSAYSFYCLQSTLIQVERAQISEASKVKILAENAKLFFNKVVVKS